MDNDNLVTELSTQIQFNIVMIGTVRKLLIEPKVFATRWGITSEKAQETIQDRTQRGIRAMSTLHCKDNL